MPGAPPPSRSSSPMPARIPSSPAPANPRPSRRAPLLGTAHVLGIAAGAATVLASGALAAALAPRLRVSAGALAALLVALHPGVLFWTASGMETPVFMLLVLLGVAAARWPAAAGALCGLAALTRPEAILFGTGVGAALAATGGRRALARFA